MIYSHQDKIINNCQIESSNQNQGTKVAELLNKTYKAYNPQFKVLKKNLRPSDLKQTSVTRI